MSAFTVISFYTPNWQYPEHARRLQADCERLGLDYQIECLATTGSYVGNCNLKPQYIQQKLHQLKRPVFWIDVDGTIVQALTELDDLATQNYDMAGNLNQARPDRVHVGSIWFNYTSATLAFVDAWSTAVAQRGIDDSVFNGLWQRGQPPVKFHALPAEYFYVMTDPDSAIPESVCVAHRLSNSDLKRAYKQQCRKPA